MGLRCGQPGASSRSAPPALPPTDEYTDFFQKVKYALNLVVSPVGLDGGGWGGGGAVGMGRL